jgi:catechol 2,3-dioxygenase-like lactoylglutathione lyase family enzyme
MITGLGHVAFRITNLEKSLDFYCQKLGFKEVKMKCYTTSYVEAGPGLGCSGNSTGCLGDC